MRVILPPARLSDVILVLEYYSNSSYSVTSLAASPKGCVLCLRKYVRHIECVFTLKISLT
jgi:hypothetical protein